jgi:hypothetical protein
MENAYKIPIGNREGKRPLGKPRNRWNGNIIIDLRETGFIWFKIRISGGLLRTLQ